VLRVHQKRRSEIVVSLVQKITGFKKGKLEITGYHNFRRRSYLIMFNTKPQIILSDAHDPVAGVKQVLKEAFKIARTFESEIALVKG